MSTFLSDNSSIAEFEKLLELDDLNSDNFCEISQFLDLNPGSDFQYADLKGVDFSNCDLSSFVFKGSDLSGSFGINIRMPSVRNLQDAILTDSVFSNYYESESYLDQSPPLRKDVLRSSKDEALAQSQWILDVSSDKGRSEEELSAITSKLFSETKFHSVKNSILYGSMRFLAEAEFKKFLFRLFATDMDDEETIRITLQMLSRMFPNDDDAINYPIAIIRSEQRLALLDAAISSVARSKHYSKFKQLVIENILSDRRGQWRRGGLRQGWRGCRTC